MKKLEFSNPQDSLELASFFHYTSRLMARVSHSGKGHGKHHHGCHGHHTQGKILKILCENGPTSQADLLEILDVRSSSLSELIGKLLTKGLVTREKNNADRRSFIISATEDAYELLVGKKESEFETVGSVFDCLNSDEKDSLYSILQKLAGSVDSITMGSEKCSYKIAGSANGARKGRCRGRHHNRVGGSSSKE